jgi:hypothetical protein
VMARPGLSLSVLSRWMRDFRADGPATSLQYAPQTGAT